DPRALMSAMDQVEGFDIRKSPFICVQDRVLLSYLEVRDNLLSGLHTQRFVDAGGIRAARLKPFARARWNRCKVDPTRWTVLEEGLSIPAITERLQQAGLESV